MKKSISMLLILAMCVSFSACGKSDAVKKTENAIASIGRVTIESKNAIAYAQKLYDILTDDEKVEVSNRTDLAYASNKFDKLIADSETQETQGNSENEAMKSRHQGKVCVCFGDSITGNMDAPYDYPTVLGEETGMTVINAGFGGCRMSDTHQNDAYAAFSMVKIADAVTSGDWTIQDSKVSELSAVCHGTEHLNALKDVDWSEVEFITIAYGTNDIQNKIAIDDADDPMNTETYLGALRYSLTRILTAYPHIKVLLLTPIYRYWNEEGVDSDSKTFGGRAFTDWGDGLLEVAESYKIPAVDMYRTLGFNAVTRTYYFPANDGTHPNSQGQKVIAGKVAAALLDEY